MNSPLFFQCDKTGRISFLTGINNLNIIICEIIIYGNQSVDDPYGNDVIYPIGNSFLCLFW